MTDSPWFALTIHVAEAPASAVDEFIAAVIERYHATGADQPSDAPTGSWRIYFHSPADQLPTTAEIASMAHDFGLPPPAVDGPHPVQLQNWQDNWREYFKPVQVTPSIRITPPWEAGNANGLEVLIEPGMAFGTGTHATTQLCIALIESLVRPGDGVLDAGTGSGILAIVAAKLGARSVVATDNDPDVFENAILNAELNDIAEGTIEYTSSSTRKFPSSHFDLIVCNMLSREFIPLLESLRAAARPGGLFIVSGLLTTEEAEVTALLKAARFAPLETRRLDEWTAIVARAT